MEEYGGSILRRLPVHGGRPEPRPLGRGPRSGEAGTIRPGSGDANPVQRGAGPHLRAASRHCLSSRLPAVPHDCPGDADATLPTRRGVQLVCFNRGVAGNVPANQTFLLDLQFQQLFLVLGTATVIAKNDAAFTGGDETENDETYRGRLLGLPRNLWTLDSITRAALGVDGVIDVLPSDPLGGVDASQSYFNLFNFDERPFGGQRRLGELYFFDLVVAHEFSRPWQKVGLVDGISEKVEQAVDRVRPIGIHPNIIQADHIEVGLQAKVILAPGHDSVAVEAAIKQRLSLDLSLLKLGSDVLYSQVMRAIAEQTGVVDVQTCVLAAAHRGSPASPSVRCRSRRRRSRRRSARTLS